MLDATRPLPTCLREHPLANREIRPVASRTGTNEVGLHDAPVRMSPPQERLHAVYGTGGEIEGRLVEEEELSAFESMVEIELDAPVIVYGLLHCGRERLTAQCLPAALARYMAMSASRSSSLGRIARSPSTCRYWRVTSSGTSLSGSRTGGEGVSTRRFARQHLAPAASEAPSTSTTNSSPPSRPTVSPWRGWRWPFGPPRRSAADHRPRGRACR